MKRTIQKIKIALLAMVCTFAVLGMTMEVKAGPADNSLKYIEVSEGSLSPVFEGSRLNYTVHVGADTTSIEVSAKTSNSNAKILSGVGTYSLSQEETKVKILVEAENGTQVTYNVTVIKDGADQPADTDEPDDTPDNTADEPDDTTDTETDTPADTGVEGYTITDKPETVEVPVGFTETTANYQDNEYPAYKFDNGDIILFYMANEAGEGGFFVYNLELGHMYPFVRVDAGEHKLILMEASAYGSAYPGEPATLTIGSQVFEALYQREPGDEYQFYAMNEDGAEGWYQYNVADETFSTFTMSYEVEEPEEEEEDEYLQNAYNELNDKFNARKDRDIKIIAGLIVLIVILIFVIINLLLRGGKASEDEGDEDDIFDEAAGRAKSFVEEEAEETEADPDETELEDFSDFEEESELFPDHKKEKKEKKKKEKKQKNHDIFDDDDENDLFSAQKVFMDKDDSDDDIEVMDLNDL